MGVGSVCISTLVGSRVVCGLYNLSPLEVIYDGVTHVVNPYAVEKANSCMGVRTRIDAFFVCFVFVLLF